MHRKQVLFASVGLGGGERFSRIISGLDADCNTCNARDMEEYLDGFDMVIYAVEPSKVDRLNELDKVLGQTGCGACLLVIEEDSLKALRLPAHSNVDFVISTASDEEIAVRARHLLWPGEETSSSDFITVGSMTLNLSTYQVQVNGKPIDFTYLEYALLAFLVTHPGHAYSRDVLLRRVWGFEYYGGSRTVDVHVRRVRAKLGSELAERLETVRGVGYMWSM